MKFIDTTDTFRKAAALINLRDAAQVVLDIDNPGETVAEVLINSNTASSLKELLNPPPAKPTKTVFKIAYYSASGSVHTENLYLPRETQFDSLQEASDEIAYLKKTTSIGNGYFVIQSDVEA